MQSYKAPLDDMRFVLHEVLEAFKNSENPDKATANQFLAEVAKMAEEVLSPLNAVGDHEGCKLNNKEVKTPTGFKEAYEQFKAAGLTSVACDPAYGGMGMPQVLNTALSEMFCSANLSFGMYPGLSHGAYNALHEYGTDAQKQYYLPKLVSGEWTGTMCLTEPQCGTDLGLIKTKAVKQKDGTYEISGTKIFISAGEHDLAPNICHLVLARIDDVVTPPGIKGISLFMVPKVNADGSRNGVSCARLEEKMGIHGNATCEMLFESAKGELVGEAHKGMRAMFVMMNEARLGVGLQGLGISEIAYQNALIYALDRVQSQPIDRKEGAGSVTIINHPDVRRELLTMKAQAEGGRALAYWLAQKLDLSLKGDKRAKDTVDLLTPIIKAHLTDNAEANASAGMQVFGGHGYIKEHGMEQFLRDARITRLYEGTNGIQALDLIGRKVLQQNLLPAYLDILNKELKGPYAKEVRAAAAQLKSATRRLRFKALFGKIMGKMGPTLVEAAGVSTDYLKLFSLVAMGHMWVKMAEAAKGKEGDFYVAKRETARFYMEKIMPQRHTYDAAIRAGASSLMALPADKFAHTQTNIGE